MNSRFRIFIVFLGMAGVMSGVAIAQASTLDQLEYPELSVVPRASDRVKSEVEKEADGKWGTFIPIQLSAAATLAAGIASYNAATPAAGYAGIGVGGAWLILTAGLSMAYHPYSSGYSELTALPKGSTRDQLTRERFAEATIENAARFGERLRWMSAGTNLAASIFMLSKAGESNNNGNFTPANSTAQGISIVSAALSVMPVIFRFHWYDVAEEQREYKKRIFAPVAQATVFQDPVTKEAIPGMALSFRF